MGKIRSTLAFFMEKTLPDLIADELIARIFIGEFKAGYRLPAERGFAETLGVDRTSLRMALRTLNRMRLVQSVSCLLYPSEAADEQASGDTGG